LSENTSLPCIAASLVFSSNKFKPRIFDDHILPFELYKVVALPLAYAYIFSIWIKD